MREYRDFTTAGRPAGPSGRPTFYSNFDWLKTYEDRYFILILIG
jgi:outer membrane biogenesis lipoprotein LolB